jgi:ribonucleoside-diphosphate reductase beta chain
MYASVPSIRAKDEFVVDMTKSILDPSFNTEGTENIQRFVHDLVGFYVIMEGIFFYAGFVMMLSFLRQNRMVGVAEQFQYILRDESVHLAFGSDLVNTIVEENPATWTPEFKQTLTDNIKKGVELEIAYARDCLPRGIMGLTAEGIAEYVKYIADRRLERIHLDKVYNAKNPFPWMSEMTDLKKEKNFFETRVTDYKHGSNLKWD